MPNVCTIVAEVVTADGDACWRDVGEVRYQSTPASSFVEWQPGAIPIDVAHQTGPIGYVDYLESGLGHGNGGLFAVAVVDAAAALVDGLQASPKLRADAMYVAETASYRLDRQRRTYGTLTATHTILDSIGIVTRTAGVTSTKIRAFDGDYKDPCDWSQMKARRPPEIIERAKAMAKTNLRYRRPDKLRIHRPPEPVYDDRLELRSGRREPLHWTSGYVLSVT